MSDKDQMVILSMRNGEHRRKGIWAEDDWADDGLTALGQQAPADLGAGFVSLDFIRAALRRRLGLLCAIVAAGFLAGSALFVELPPAYEASTSLLLTNNPAAPAGTAILDDQAIAQSSAVAEDVIRKLGLRENAATLIGQYTVTAPTDRVLLITTRATSSEAAVREANALAASFLTFQARLLQTQAALVNSALQRQVNQEQQYVNGLTAKISRLSAEPASPQRRATLNSLQSERSKAAAALTVLKTTADQNQANTQVTITSQLRGSQVLNAATPIKQSRKRRLLLYAGGGVLAGLVLGLGGVVVGALISDRLRRRDDISRALGAPIKLSVGKVRLSRSQNGQRSLVAVPSDDVRRIMSYLAKAVMPRSGGPASLAVVPIDEVQLPAVCLAALAVSRAQQGLQVVVADLSRGGLAARLLGVADVGVHRVQVDGGRLVVAVLDEEAPIGPLNRGSRTIEAVDPVATVCASADLLLALVPLDPSQGPDHLAGWATAAVATVTAGQSSGARICAVGEMLRLADVQQISAVLIGADKADETLGVTRMPISDPGSESSHSGERGLVVAADSSAEPSLDL